MSFSFSKAQIELTTYGIGFFTFIFEVIAICSSGIIQVMEIIIFSSFLKCHGDYYSVSFIS